MTKKTLCQSDLCATVMAVLHQGDFEPAYAVNLGAVEAVAIASYVKTHRINVKNVAEVIGIVWPDARMWAHHRTDAQTKQFEADITTGGEDAQTILSITFGDGSQGLMIGEHGIFEEYEPFGWSDRMREYFDDSVKKLMPAPISAGLAKD